MIDSALKLSDRFSHVVVSDDVIVLVGDEDATALEDERTIRVLRMIDGCRGSVSIAEALAPDISPEVTHFLLLQMEHAGLLERVVEGGVARDSLPVDDQDAGEVAEEILSVWDRRRGSGVLAALSSVPDCRILLCEDYLAPTLAEECQHLDGILLVRVGRRSAWLGPRLESGRTACIECLQERLRLNLTARAFIHDCASTPRVRVTRLAPASSSVALARAAAALLAMAHDPRLSEMTFDHLAVHGPAGVSWHAVARLPHCGRCARTGSTFAGALDRGAPPEATLARYARLVSPLTGVVRHLTKVPVPAPLSSLIHVYTSSHPLDYGPPSLRAVCAERRDHSGGKGRTDLDARVSALCESLERFSSLHRGSEPVMEARASDLEPNVIVPNDLMLYSERQLAERNDWNAEQAGDFQIVPEPYENQVIEWSELRSLIDQAVVCVPSAHVFFGFRGAGSSFGKADSNGVAGGRSLEEATLFGLLELIERDAVAIWWYNRIPRPGLDLDSFDDSHLHEVRALYESMGRELWALDLTTDIGIPCVAALSHVPRADAEDIIFGFGAGLSMPAALARAVGELNQMLPTILRPRRERRRQLLPEFRDAIAWWDEARVSEHPYLLPDDREPPRPASNFPMVPSLDARQSLDHCVERVRSVGVDVLVHDLTRPDVALPVARVVAPGLRHFWRRLGSGRLYEVPVRMGWVEHPVPEGAMNPVSMFV